MATTISKGRSLRDAIIDAATRIRLAGHAACDSLGEEREEEGEGRGGGETLPLPAATAALAAAAASARVAAARAGLILGCGDGGAPPPSSSDAISVVDALSAAGEAAAAAGGDASRAALAALPGEISALYSKEIEARSRALSGALASLVESAEGADEIGAGASEAALSLRRAAGQAVSAAEFVEKTPTPFRFLVSQLKAATAEVEGAAEEAEELAREVGDGEEDGEREGTATAAGSAAEDAEAAQAEAIDVDFESGPLSARERAVAAAVARALRCCSALLKSSLAAAAASAAANSSSSSPRSTGNENLARHWGVAAIAARSLRAAASDAGAALYAPQDASEIGGCACALEAPSRALATATVAALSESGGSKISSSPLLEEASARVSSACNQVSEACSAVRAAARASGATAEPEP